MRVEDMLRTDDLDLKVVVAGAQCAKLLEPAIDSPLADLRGVGTGNGSAFLGELQILFPAKPLPYAPAGALLTDLAKLGAGDLQQTTAPHPRGHPHEQLI